MIDADTIISTYSTYLYGDVTLPSDVRTTLKQFLETDESGALLPIAPSSTEYYNKKIRGLISIMLSQPEYMLLRGSDIPTKTDTNEQHFLDSITGKLIFIELYGGNDYLTSLIPKDEYSTYVDYRSNGSGTIALS